MYSENCPRSNHDTPTGVRNRPTLTPRNASGRYRAIPRAYSVRERAREYDWTCTSMCARLACPVREQTNGHRAGPVHGGRIAGLAPPRIRRPLGVGVTGAELAGREIDLGEVAGNAVLRAVSGRVRGVGHAQNGISRTGPQPRHGAVPSHHVARYDEGASESCAVAGDYDCGKDEGRRARRTSKEATVRHQLLRSIPGPRCSSKALNRASSWARGDRVRRRDSPLIRHRTCEIRSFVTRETVACTVTADTGPHAISTGSVFKETSRLYPSPDVFPFAYARPDDRQELCLKTPVFRGQRVEALEIRRNLAAGERAELRSHPEIGRLAGLHDLSAFFSALSRLCSRRSRIPGPD